RAVGNARAVDLHVVDLRAVDSAGRVREVAVQQLDALEAGRLAQPVDRLQDRVNLKLIGIRFFLGQPAGVRRLVDQALQLGQQVADFAEATFGRANDVIGAACVVDRLRNPSLFGLEIFGGDETGGVVRAGVDSQTGAQSLERRVQALVIFCQHALRD